MKIEIEREALKSILRALQLSASAHNPLDPECSRHYQAIAFLIEALAAPKPAAHKPHNLWSN